MNSCRHNTMPASATRRGYQGDGGEGRIESRARPSYPIVGPGELRIGQGAVPSGLPVIRQVNFATRPTAATKAFATALGTFNRASVRPLICRPLLGMWFTTRG